MQAKGPGRLAAGLLLLLLTAPALGAAAPSSPAASAAGACVSCHGGVVRSPDGGDYNVPHLRGQNPAYLMRALDDYRQGRRRSPAMQAQTPGLAGIDLTELASLVAGARPKPAGLQAAKAPGAVTRVCGGCHGVDGMGRLPEYPSLAGQDVGYLRHTMQEYAAGHRPNEAMKSTIQKMTPAEIDEVAAYYAALPGLGALR